MDTTAKEDHRCTQKPVYCTHCAFEMIKGLNDAKAVVNDSLCVLLVIKPNVFLIALHFFQMSIAGTVKRHQNNSFPPVHTSLEKKS